MLLVGGLVAQAEAGVTNPGSFNISLANGTLDIDGASLDVGFTGLSATGAGTAATDGTVSITSLSFPSFNFELLANNGPGSGIPGTASPAATLPWTGTIDPDTGSLVLSGDLVTNVAVPALGASNCPLGPFPLEQTTGVSGASHGETYDPGDGTAKIVDHNFGIPSLVFVEANAAACPQTVVDLFNGGLPFPIAEGFARIAFDVDLDPAPEGTTTTGDPNATTAPTTVTTTSIASTTAPTTQPPTSGPTTVASTTTPTTVTTTTVPDLPSFSVNDVTIDEPEDGSVKVQFVVKLSEPSLQKTSVKFTTVNGSATSETKDYSRKNGTAKFGPGKTEKVISVTIKSDDVIEAAETFTFELNTPKNATIDDGIGLATIIDPLATGIKVVPGEITEGNRGTKSLTVKVILTEAFPVQVKVNYTTAAGTADAGTDFRVKTGTIGIKAGSLQNTFRVDIYGDTVAESLERFSINLSSPIGAPIADPSSDMTIIDND